MSIIDQSLLSIWHEYGQLASIIVGLVGLVVILGYIIKLITIGEFKAKYDYINMYEIKLLWFSTVLILVSLVLFSSSMVEDTGLLAFLVRLFVSVMFGIIGGVTIQNILKFYYPFYIEKRLKHLRFTPRYSPEGNRMKLLSEEEEDVYLDEGMQAEENVFSVDYDVWIDEETGHTKIEKYHGRLHAMKCAECNYQTLKVFKEEVVQFPTHEEEGELIKFYACGYCGNKERTSFQIAKLKEGEEA